MGNIVKKGWGCCTILLALFLAIFTPVSPVQAGYAAIVVDANTGNVLYSRNAQNQNHPASLTKLMTLYMTFGALQTGVISLDQRLSVSAHAASMPASKLGLDVGQTISVRDAILAVIAKSANDVAVVLAEALGGSEVRFASLMTAQARRLGMTSTTFRNASGLHDDFQRSTARDMAILARALIKVFPRYYKFFSTTSFNFEGTTIDSHNNILYAYPGADGLKTGYIDASGYNLVASARRQGKRVIGVVFGGESASWRDEHMVALLDHGFASLSGRPIVQAARRQSTVPARTLALRPGTPRMAVPQTPVIRQPAASTAAWGSWGIQVGAFGSLETARRETVAAQKSLAALALTLEPVIQPHSAKGRQFYRARLLGLSEPRARAACQKLESLEKDCMVVPPSQGENLASAR